MVTAGWHAADRVASPADAWILNHFAVVWCRHCAAERAVYPPGLGTSRPQVRCTVCRRRVSNHAAPRR
jgi:ribosomal protein S27E